MTNHIFKEGQKVKFKEEAKPYDVMACDGGFVICTKPFNLKSTVLYSIIDIRKNIRGTENLVFCMGFESREQCHNALRRLQLGESEISERNNIPLEIEWIK